MLIGIVGWVVSGLIVGFIAAQVVSLRGDDPRLGVVMGAVGAVIGGGLYSYFGGHAVTPFNPTSLFFAAIAAVAAQAAWHGWRWVSAARA
jgi:uncharacterized membrane protein YeaQ/YmgE (transglycosylase-associated protein family)